jgi:ribosome biogenesis GTPase
VRRLERELVLAYESGATPVIVLTKADEVSETEIDDAIDEIEGSATGVDILVTSAIAGTGMDALHALTRDNRTVAFIGASGVGKSTLVNALVGHEVQETGAVRESDQRGRHTTTARELVLIPGGGVLVDTPGLRAVSLWDADEGLSRAFADIEALAAQCKFRDCSHRVEPGCAVRAAIETGALDEARFENYLRLDAELDAAERRRHGRIMSKAIRQMYKERPPKL